jgi:hypothetical protein
MPSALARASPGVEPKAGPALRQAVVVASVAAATNAALTSAVLRWSGGCTTNDTRATGRDRTGVVP